MNNTKNKTGAWAKKLISVSASLLVIGAMNFFSACENVASGADGDTAPALSARVTRGVGQPTPITSAADLALIGDDPGYPADGQYLLTASFTLSSWDPICDPNTTTEFTGEFDGGGNTITISDYSAAALASDYLAIFAVVGDGTATPLIENLTVNFATSAFSTTAQYVGGIAAYAQNATFNTDVVTGTLAVTYTGTATDNFDVGGIAAYASSGSFSGNTVSGVNFTVTNTSASASNIGGEAGYSLGVLFTGETTTGDSVITSNDVSGSNVGAITGYASGDSFNSFTTGGTLTVSITSTGADNAAVGGVAGYSTGGTFELLNTRGNVTASYTNTSTTNTPSAYVGGLAGDAEGAVFLNDTVSAPVSGAANMLLSSDYTNYNFLAVGGAAGYVNGGSISLSSTGTTINAKSAQTESHAGGFVGRANKFAITDSSGTAQSTSTGANSNTSAGGFAGYILTSTVSNSHTTAGDITVSAPSGSGPYDVYQVFGGGLIGYSGNDSAITLCYSAGQTVSAINSAYPYSGGLAGYNYGVQVYPNPANNGSTIVRSYSTNTVIASATDNGIPYAGGLAGYNSAVGSVIEDCYSWGNVTATTGGTDAWAGGVVGAVSAGATLDRSYATGTVTATAGSGALPYPQTGIDDGAWAGGVVGYAYNYYVSQTTTVENSVGLNSTVTAQGSSVANEAHRVVGHTTLAYPATITNNLGSTAMTLIPTPVPLNAVLDGANTAATPAQSVFTGLGWDFNTVWVMGSSYPVLQ